MLSLCLVQSLVVQPFLIFYVIFVSYDTFWVYELPFFFLDIIIIIIIYYIVFISQWHGE